MSSKKRAQSETTKPPEDSGSTDKPRENAEQYHIQQPAKETIYWLIVGTIGLNLIAWFGFPLLLENINAIENGKNLMALVNTSLLFGAISVAWQQRKLTLRLQTDKKEKEQKPATIPPTWIDTVIRWSIGLVGGIFVIFLAVQVIQRFNNGNIDLLNLELLAIILLCCLYVLFNLRGLAKNYPLEPQTEGIQTPLTQQRQTSELPQWIRQLPLQDVNDQKEDFKLISDEVLAGIKPSFSVETISEEGKPKDKVAYETLINEINFLETYVVSLFKKRDYDAKYYQTAYRRYQIGYMLLAILAAIFGALLALNLDENNASNPNGRFWVAVFGFLETVVALMTTYLASISGRENALEKWLENRQKAEGLRREYQRFLMRLQPYDKGNPADLEESLKRRAAAINLLGSPDIDDDDLRNALVEAAKDKAA
jgi:hypothetical protein